MDILGIGVPELAFIILIALIVLGPKDMQKAGKTIGRFMRKIVTSSEWHTVKDVSKQVRTLPNEWMREAEGGVQGLRDDLGIDNTLKDIYDKDLKDLLTESGRPKFVEPPKEKVIEDLVEGENS